MRFYNRPHTYYCGIDLYVKTMYVCILDGDGQVLVHRNVSSTPAAFLEEVVPYREGLVVAAECMFTWYGPRSRVAPFLLGPARKRIRSSQSVPKGGAGRQRRPDGSERRDHHHGASLAGIWPADAPAEHVHQQVDD